MASLLPPPLLISLKFLSIALRVPFWAVSSLLWRPRQTWSWQKAFVLRLSRNCLALGLTNWIFTVAPNHLELLLGPTVKGLWVQPVSKDLIVGALEIWAKVADVSAVQIPGYWVDRTGTATPNGHPPFAGERVLYLLHGGGYVVQSAHPSDDAVMNITRGMVDTVGPVRRGFSVEYRLSGPSANPFPAALLDALAGYMYLVDTVGVSPENIILEGDSAGGNLALALTRYLVEYKGTKGLPAPPGSIVLLSPWSDLGISAHNDPKSSFYTNMDSDYLGKYPFIEPSLANGYYPNQGMWWPVRVFLGPHGVGMADCNPYISPVIGTFHGFPRTFIVSGGGEMFVDMIRALERNMKRDMGEGEVKYLEAEDAVHDFIAFGSQPEAQQTLEAISAWIGE